MFNQRRFMTIRNLKFTVDGKTYDVTVETDDVPVGRAR